MVLQPGGSAWGLQIISTENKLVTKCHKGSRTWTDSLDKQPKLKKMDMRFGTRNVKDCMGQVRS
jgi:hypothetical protein